MNRTEMDLAFDSNDWLRINKHKHYTERVGRPPYFGLKEPGVGKSVVTFMQDRIVTYSCSMVKDIENLAYTIAKE